MFKRVALTAIAAVLAAGPAGAEVSPAQMARAAANVHAHMSFLASDLLKGREAGTPEFDIAAAYVASQMEQLGLKPFGALGGASAGAKASYFQPVPLAAYRLSEPGTMSLKDKAGVETQLAFGTDFTRSGDGLNAETKLEAGLVFVGYGIVAPEHKRDDYKGIDAKGKIVVLLEGAPKFLQTEERAYYGNRVEKLRTAEAHGAVAVVVVRTLTSDRLRPFPVAHRSATSWGMSWRTAAGKAFSSSQISSLGTISTEGAEKLFAGSGHKVADILAAAETPQGAIKGFALPLRLSATSKTEFKTLESENIVGVLPGSDPKLKDEYVVLSAHLDHLGIVQPVNGDNIANGALDNAAGVSTTLEVARFFQESGQAPRRSIIFLVDTGEEKGLVGADYYSRNPTVPISQIVADVDLDMPILTADFTDVTAYGADRSTIGPAVKRAADKLGLKLSPDPIPDEGIFTRSDHYRFVQQGVPAVYPITGYEGEGGVASTHFLATDYHKPSDDLSLPIRYEVGAKFARLNYEITRELTDADAKPAWNPGDFFGEKYARGK